MDRRCAVIASGRSALPEGLLVGGARSVHHYATDADRRPLALRLDRTLLVRDLPAGEFDVREGAFDLVVVESLALLADVPTWLGRFRRLLGASGILVAGAPRATAAAQDQPFSSFSVHELDDLLSVQFAWVDLRGLASFHGMLVAPIGARGSIGDFVLHPLDDGRAAPESLLAIASQKSRALEPSLLLELDAPQVDVRATVANDVAQVLDEHATDELRRAREALTSLQEKATEERDDLRDTIDLREAALRASEAENDRLRTEVEALTTHLDRALAGAVPAHLARLEALADKDRPRVVEAPMSEAERARFHEELRAADAARAEADDACVKLEARLHASEIQRKAVERELAGGVHKRDHLASQVAMLLRELEDLERLAADEVADREARLHAMARATAEADAATRALARWLKADALRPSVGLAMTSTRPHDDEGALVRNLLDARARADLLAVEVQALHARLRRIVDAADDAATSPVDMGASEPRLAAVSPASAASSLPKLSGSHSDDG